MRRTFVDAGVLIWFTRFGDAARNAAATALIHDDSRIFLSSPFLEAELIPHARRGGRAAELQTLESYFGACESIADVSEILKTAEQVLAERPMGLADALHIAAVCLLEADEFVTTETGRRSARSAALFGNSFVPVVTLDARR